MVKPLLFAALLCAAGCSSQAGKYRHPVVVNRNDAEIHQTVSPDSPVIALADKGDTLELGSSSMTDLYMVSLDAHRTRFKGGEAAGFIQPKALTIPDSTLAKLKAGDLFDLPTTPTAKAEHINQAK